MPWRRLGGWTQALRALGRHGLGVEYDPDIVATARAAGHACELGDVAAVDPRELLSGEACEGLIFSPPCPSFSAAGKQLGRKDLPAIHRLIDDAADGIDSRADAHMHDPRSILTVEPMRWATLLLPEWIALEQVPAVLPLWEHMARRLRAQHGYSVWTGIVYAERYGVPQTRQRAVLLASRAREVSEPVATHRRYFPPGHRYAESGNGDGHLPRWVSMAEALGWGMTERPSMSVTSGGTYTGGAEVFGNGARKGIRREHDAGRWMVAAGITGEGTPRPDSAPTPTISGQGAAEWIDDPEKYDRGNQRGTTELRKIVRKRKSGQHVAAHDDDWPGRRPATFVNGRGTIAAPGHKGSRGGSDPAPRQMDGAIRVSIQEAAVLQTFPPDYPFQGTKTKQHLQVGNAVPVKLAEALLRSVT